MTDFRALCAELLEWAERTSSHYFIQADVVVRARAALAEQPEEPIDDELWAVGDEDFRANYYPTDAIKFARAVLARWGQPYKLPTTQPIPVSERLPQVKVILRDIHNPTPQPILACARLPEPKDCDADGMCWACRSFDPSVDDLGDFWQRIPCEWLENFARWTHWLPANALPTPEAQ